MDVPKYSLLNHVGRRLDAAPVNERIEQGSLEEIVLRPRERLLLPTTIRTEGK